jgi:hypothetical protein
VRSFRCRVTFRVETVEFVEKSKHINLHGSPDAFGKIRRRVLDGNYVDGARYHLHTAASREETGRGSDYKCPCIHYHSSLWPLISLQH